VEKLRYYLGHNRGLRVLESNGSAPHTVGTFFEDGTLEERMKGTAAAGRVRACAHLSAGPECAVVHRGGPDAGDPVPSRLRPRAASARASLPAPPRD